MKALILAGGFATRLWPLCENRAKPLLLLNGKTILAHILEKIPNNVETILLTNSKFFTDFEKELKKLKREEVGIFCEDAFADGQKLGALGAISAVSREKNINETILVFAGDNLLPNLSIEQLFCSDDEAKIASREVGSFHEARKFGVLELDKNRVVNFAEKPENPSSKLVSTGFIAIGKNLLPILHDFSKKFPDALGGIFIELLKQKKEVLATLVDGEWFDIGGFETYLEAHQKLQKKSLQIQGKSREKNNKFSGKVFIGENCVIEDCKLSDVIIYPNTILKKCVISRSVIDSNCHLEGLDLNQKLIRSGMKQIF